MADRALLGGGHRVGGPNYRDPETAKVRQTCTIAGFCLFLLLVWEAIVVVPVGSLGVVSVLGRYVPLPHGCSVFRGVSGENRVRIPLFFFGWASPLGVKNRVKTPQNWSYLNFW